MAQTIDRQQARHGASSTVEKRRVKTSEENERRSNSLHGPSKLVRALNDFEEVTTRARDLLQRTAAQRPAVRQQASQRSHREPHRLAAWNAHLFRTLQHNLDAHNQVVGPAKNRGSTELEPRSQTRQTRRSDTDTVDVVTDVVTLCDLKSNLTNVESSLTPPPGALSELLGCGLSPAELENETGVQPPAEALSPSTGGTGVQAQSKMLGYGLSPRVLKDEDKAEVKRESPKCRLTGVNSQHEAHVEATSTETNRELDDLEQELGDDDVEQELATVALGRRGDDLLQIDDMEQELTTAIEEFQFPEAHREFENQGASSKNEVGRLSEVNLRQAAGAGVQHLGEEEPETPRIDQSSSRVHEGTWLVDSSPLEGQRALAVVVDAVDGSQVGPLNPNRPTVDESQVEDLGVRGNQDPRHLSAGVGVDHPRASVTASTLYQTPRGCHSSRSSASRTGSSSSRCLV